MAVLVLWLKKLILLVLLATFLDLLLPSSAYSKYVKLAMGLIILLALLSPILDLFHKDISLTQLSFTAGEAGKGAPDFARIEALAKRLAADNDEQANRYVEQQIGALIKKQIEAQHGVKVETVDVHVHPDGQKAKQPIERISIIVALDKPRETGT
ncbi:stage III sporulation protein AF, partial [Bacillus licheniformis]|uniref:stage III sporulation protein AF n=1 Tax=Bacillus licheniformis TaxID=1402 RepID=UPI00237CCD29